MKILDAHVGNIVSAVRNSYLLHFCFRYYVLYFSQSLIDFSINYSFCLSAINKHNTNEFKKMILYLNRIFFSSKMSIGIVINDKNICIFNSLNFKKLHQKFCQIVLSITVSNPSI